MPFYRYLVFAPLELVIWIIEAVIYRKTAANPAGNGSSDRLRAVRQRIESAAATLFSVHMVYLSEKKLVNRQVLFSVCRKKSFGQHFFFSAISRKKP